MSQHSQNTFLTLTYNDDHIPVNFSLRSRDLQLCFKRVRKSGLKFRYFACGEYGSKSFRPHYHAILFGVDYWSARQHFEAAWTDPHTKEPFGTLQTVYATVETACYTAGYVTKKLSKNQILAECGMEPEFIRSSKKPAVGFAAIEQFLKAHKFNTSFDVFSQICIAGKLRPVPKFIKDKLRELVYDEEYRQKLKEARVLCMKDQIDELVEKHFGVKNGSNYKSYALEANGKEHKQDFLNIHARQKIFNERKNI